MGSVVPEFSYSSLSFYLSVRKGTLFMLRASLPQDLMQFEDRPSETIVIESGRQPKIP